MPSLGEWAFDALDDARRRAEVRQKLWEAARRRSAAEAATWRTRKCPACGEGLKLASAQLWQHTLFYCPMCHWMKAIPVQMDEGRLPGVDPFTPGVTGKLKGTPVVRITADGKVEVIDVRKHGG